MAFNYEFPYTDPNLYNDDWLLAKMKELIVNLEDLEEYKEKGSMRKRPTEKGRGLGITLQMRTVPNTGARYACCVFSPEAQRFVIEHYTQ